MKRLNTENLRLEDGIENENASWIELTSSMEEKCDFVDRRERKENTDIGAFF